MLQRLSLYKIWICSLLRNSLTFRTLQLLLTLLRSFSFNTIIIERLYSDCVLHLIINDKDIQVILPAPVRGSEISCERKP